MKSVKNIPPTFKGKIAIVRADLNVTIHEGRIMDSTRIKEMKPTIDFLLGKGCYVVVVSHFGRPKPGNKSEFSLRKIIPFLNECWGLNVEFLDSFHPSLSLPKKPCVYLLENVRFEEGEEKNTPDFSEKLSRLGDFYVNDAFSASHRAHASIVGITHYLPSYAGLQFIKEIESLETLFKKTIHPFLGILGGSKISTKIKVIQKLLNVVDHLWIGGAMATTFLYAKGLSIGQSFFEKDYIDIAQDLLNGANNISLPFDVMVLDGHNRIVSKYIDHIKSDDVIYDVGPESLKELEKIIQSSRSVLWNGPLGYYEKPPFDGGSKELGEMIATATSQQGVFSLIGGGDTVASIKEESKGSFSYVSTAGGALLEYMENGTLPGIEALNK